MATTWTIAVMIGASPDGAPGFCPAAARLTKAAPSPSSQQSKVCSVCNETKADGSYSGAQWKAKADERVCLTCAGRYV